MPTCTSQFLTRFVTLFHYILLSQFCLVETLTFHVESGFPSDWIHASSDWFRHWALHKEAAVWWGNQIQHERTGSQLQHGKATSSIQPRWPTSRCTTTMIWFWQNGWESNWSQCLIGCGDKLLEKLTFFTHHYVNYTKSKIIVNVVRHNLLNSSISCREE